MINSRSAAFLLSLASAISYAPAVHAVTYNLATDWSTTSNPNGPWEYLRGSTLLPYQPTSCCGLPPGPSFAPSAAAGTFLPVFFRPGAQGSDFFVHSYDSFNGGAFIGEATLTWTAPVAGPTTVSGYFYYAQAPLQRSNDVTIRMGTVVVASQTVSYLNHADAASRWDFSSPSIDLNAGDVIAITFQRTSGFSAGTVVAGNVIVSSIPEPAQAALLLIGFGTIVATRKLRERRPHPI